MEESQFECELRNIMHSLIEMNKGLHRLDLLQLEVLQIKTDYHNHIESLYNSLCKLFGGFITDSLFTEFTNSYSEYTAQTDLLLLTNNESNGFGNQQPTTTLLEEIKQMIIELKIKGSVRERPNGLIELRTQALGSIYGRTKMEIEQKLTQKLKEAKSEKQTPKKKTAPLFSEFYSETYLPYKKQELKENSIEGIESHYRSIIRDKGDKPLNQFTAGEIEKYLYTIAHTRTRQVIRGLFNNMFTYAQQLGIIKNNPCNNVTQMKHKQKEGKAMSFTDQKAFFKELYISTKVTDEQRLYYTLSYLIGARRQEVLDLTPSDIDFANNCLRIPGTKTGGSDRTIPMFPLARQVLEKLSLGKNGTYFQFSEDVATRRIKKIAKEYRLHDLRHTYGTIQICVEKLDAKTVSLYMGHSKIEMTLKRYTHPEQLAPNLFYNGALNKEEKLAKMREQYAEVLAIIEDFLAAYPNNTQ